MHFWYVFQSLSHFHSQRTDLVRKYVEGMKESAQLLDLLSAAGSNDIEPTKAKAGRQALYPDVRIIRPPFFLVSYTL